MSLQYTLPAAASQLKTPWLTKRSSFFIRQVVNDYLEVDELYCALYQDFRHHYQGAARGADVLLLPSSASLRETLYEQLSAILGTESSRGLLWRLKDLCHIVWPESERQQNVLGSLVDWLVGSLFHEAMKLKENLYLLNNYGPAVFCAEQDEGHRDRTTGDTYFSLSQLVDIPGVFRRVALDTEHQLERIALLFGRGCYLLRVMMPALAENELVVRLLAEKEIMLAEVWGEPLERIFSDMFGGNVAHGFCFAGMSYLRSQWYHQALVMYRRALAVDKECSEAMAKVVQLEAITADGKAVFGRQTL